MEGEGADDRDAGEVDRGVVGDSLRAWLAAETAAGRLAVDDIEGCVGQFFGMLDHDLLWPALYGDPAPRTQADRDRAVRRTVRAVLARYGIAAG